jgi:hypothetical protein
MPEYQNTGEKVSLASAFLQVNPALAFRHHGQSSTAEAVDMNGRFQKQGGKNWILPK